MAIDWSIVFGGVVACLLAIVVSSVELLVRYAPRNFTEIFGTRQYAGFAILNASFCVSAYVLLPDFAGLFSFGGEQLDFVQRPYLRGFVAGMGYLLVARSSILDFTHNGQTRGIGFDYIYTTISTYLLTHHSRRIVERLRSDFRNIYYAANGHKNPLAYLRASEVIIGALPSEDKVNVKQDIEACLSGEKSAASACQSIYLILRNVPTSADVVKQAIEDAEEDIVSDEAISHRYNDLTGSG